MSVTPVVKNGKSYWQVQVIRPGTRRRRFLDRKRYRRKDALAVEREIIEALERGAEPASPTTKKGAVPNTTTAMAALDAAGCTPEHKGTSKRRVRSFEVFAERYLAVVDQHKPDFKNKARNVRRHLVPFFGSTPLDQISRMMIDDFRVMLRTPTGEKASHPRHVNRRQKPITGRRKGGAKTPRTINNILGTLRAILNLAYEYEIVDRVPRIKKEPEVKQDPDYLDFEEADLVLRSVPRKWHTFVLMALRTGLRRAELFELRWKDLQLTELRPRVRVARALEYRADRNHRVKTTKGRRPRSVPLCEELLNALRDEQDRRDPKPGDLVFPADDGGYLDYSRIYRMLAKSATRAGLPKRVRLHMLRHTFASHCYMLGIPPQVVQKWLGHQSVVTTERYAHLRPDTGDELIKLLDGGRVIPADFGATTGATIAGRRKQNAV